MVDSGIGQGLTLNSVLEIIYLKHELQSTKHLVSLDAYNLFIATTVTEAFSEYNIQILPTVSHINIYQTHLLYAIIIILTFARYSHNIHAI